jgi:hypothetical protein
MIKYAVYDKIHPCAWVYRCSMSWNIPILHPEIHGRTTIFQMASILVASKNDPFWTTLQWIVFFWENFTGKTPYFMGKIDGFRLRFSLKPIHWTLHLAAGPVPYTAMTTSTDRLAPPVRGLVRLVPVRATSFEKPQDLADVYWRYG